MASTSHAPSSTGASGTDSKDVSTDDHVTEQSQPKGKNRQGKNSKSKRAEQHRIKKNAEWDKERVDTWKQFVESLRMTTDAAVELRTQSLDISKPTRKVDVTTGYFNIIALATVKTLYRACKIPPASSLVPETYDLQTVIWVTQLQLEAKFFFGSLNTQYAPPSSYNNYDSYLRVSALFSTALLPLALGISQIGKCVTDGQTIVGMPGSHPMTNLNESDARLYSSEVANLFVGDDVSGCYLTPYLNTDGRALYFRPTANRQQCYERQILRTDGRTVLFNSAVYDGMDFSERVAYGQLVPLRPALERPSLNELSSRYSDFIGRVTKKLNDQVFASLELEKGIGTAAQLVGIECQPDSRALTYATRDVTTTDILMSAYYLLGYDTGDPFHDEDIANITSSVEIAGVPELLSGLLVKRLR